MQYYIMYNIVSVDTIRHIILDVNIYFHFFLCFYIFFLCLRHNLAQRGVCQFPSISSHKAFSAGGGSNSICSKRIPIYYNNAAGGRLSSTTYTVTPYTFVTASVGSLLLSSLPDLFHEKNGPPEQAVLYLFILLTGLVTAFILFLFYTPGC